MAESPAADMMLPTMLDASGWLSSVSYVSSNDSISTSLLLSLIHIYKELNHTPKNIFEV